MLITDPGTGGTSEPDRARRPYRFRTELLWFLGCLVTGVALGVAWRFALPIVVSAADPERAVASDGVLGGLGVLAGLGTAAALALAPGPMPQLRFAVVLTGCIVGSGLALGTGLLLGVARIGAIGAAFLWPVVASGGTFLATAIAAALVRRPLPDAGIHPT